MNNKFLSIKLTNSEVIPIKKARIEELKEKLQKNSNIDYVEEQTIQHNINKLLEEIKLLEHDIKLNI